MPTDDIEFRVVEGNGLTYEADALVLKHAQALYGLDARVVHGNAIPIDRLPVPGSFRTFPGPPGVSAATVLFVGTRPIEQFSYPDVRKFGYEALRSLASAVPNAGEVAITLHGVGYGLDELECLDAEVAGLLDAVVSREVPESLVTVTFLEIDPGRATRMRERLASLLGAASTVTTDAEASLSVSDASRETLRAVGSTDERRPHAFVAMPFDDSFTDVFHYGLANAVRANGLLSERIDEQAFVGDILERLKDRIRGAKVLIADVTGSNANVFLEIGFAWGHGVPTVLVCHKDSPLKFDIQGQRCIFYTSIRDLETRLSDELGHLLPLL